MLEQVRAVDSSSSTDDTGYALDSGDGTSGAGTNTSHVSSAKGNYTMTVTLTVTDTGSLTSSVHKSVTIHNKRHRRETRAGQTGNDEGPRNEGPRHFVTAQVPVGG